MRFRKFLKPYKTRGSSFREHTEILIGDNHRDTIVYWSCIGQELEDCWLISSKMRELL